MSFDSDNEVAELRKLLRAAVAWINGALHAFEGDSLPSEREGKELIVALLAALPPDACPEGDDELER